MKKAAFILIVTMTLSILTGCGGNTAGQQSEVQQDVSTESRDQSEVELLTSENQELESKVELLNTENQELESKVELLTTENQELKSEVERLKEQLASSSVDSNQSKEQIHVSVLYNSKIITLSPKLTDIEAINNPTDIYQGERDRDLTLLISGVSVKNVYVNQSQKVEDITYNETENIYSVPYYMNGEGQYTFLIETEESKFYLSVQY